MILLEKLAQARDEGRAADLNSDDLPTKITKAYEIGLSQVPNVAAWKIGGANPWSRNVFKNTESFFGPLGQNEVHFGDNAIPLNRLNAPLAEPEIMLELAVPDRSDQQISFSRMGIGFEIPASVLPEALKPSLFGQIVDRAGAGALWIAGVEEFNKAALEQEFTSEASLNSSQIVQGGSHNLVGGPLGAADEFLRLALRYGVSLKSGQWIATGGLSPAVPVGPDDVVRVKARSWDVSVRFE